VASVDALLDLREDFEKRLRGFFKETVREANQIISRHKCEGILSTLTMGRKSVNKSAVSQINVEEIDALTFPNFKKDCASLIE